MLPHWSPQPPLLQLTQSRPQTPIVIGTLDGSQGSAHLKSKQKQFPTNVQILVGSPVLQLCSQQQKVDKPFNIKYSLKLSNQRLLWKDLQLNPKQSGILKYQLCKQNIHPVL